MEHPVLITFFFLPSIGDFNGYRIRLLHPLGSLLSHDCAPNVKRYYSSIANGNYLQCRASVNIQKGQKLTISYTDPLIPTLIRRQILKDVSFKNSNTLFMHKILNKMKK